jgi:hypothetical protein
LKFDIKNDSKLMPKNDNYKCLKCGVINWQKSTKIWPPKIDQKNG